MIVFLSSQGSPLAVAFCHSESDVVATVAWAAALPARPPLLVRAGRHSYEGYSSGTGAVVIDVSNLTAMAVDSDSDTALFGAGVELVEAYSAVIQANRTFPGGTCPTVGLAGFVLGGG